MFQGSFFHANNIFVWFGKKLKGTEGAISSEFKGIESLSQTQLF